MTKVFQALLLILLTGSAAFSQTAGTFVGVAGGNERPLTAAALNAAFATKQDAAGDVSAQTATATGGTVTRTLAARFGDVINILDRGADPTGTADSTSAIAGAITAAQAVHGVVRVPHGTYKTSGPLDIYGASIVGDGPSASLIVSSDTNAADPVLYAGGIDVVIQGIGLQFASGVVTGSETANQRAGLMTYSLQNSNGALQRGSAVRNVEIYNVGTAICDGGSSSKPPFSVTFDTIRVSNFSFAGVGFTANLETGIVVSNLYVSNGDGPGSVTGPFPNATYGIQFAGSSSELSLNQINVEWGHYVTPVYISQSNGLHIGTMHLEETTLANASTGLVYVGGSNATIDDLAVFYSPITTSGWSILRVGQSTNAQASDTSLTSNYVHVGVLNVVGLNDGLKVTSGNGISSLTGFAFTDRETADNNGPFYVQIDHYAWQSFETDTSVYAAFPNDPHAGITYIATPAGPPVRMPALLNGYPGGVQTWTGSGAPSLTAASGSLYLRTDGSTGSRLYVSAGGGTWAAASGL
jgi:hypothetical protein